MRMLIEAGDIQSDTPVPDGQIQPASIDLRLGDIAYRVRGSFLPGPHATVLGRLKSFTMHKIDLTEGAVLEKGCVYLVPLQERLRLKKDISGMANPKSSTGRLDIFTRVITDYGEFFGYPPGTLARYTQNFTAHVQRKSSYRHPAKPARLRQGSHPFETAMRRLHERTPLVASSGMEKADITSTGVAFTVDLQGDPDTGIIGYKAKRHADVIDVENVNHYDIHDFWDPIATEFKQLILDTDDFYILASKEAVSVPPDHAAEMRPDTYVGEFRVHYAGFFDQGQP